MRRFHSNGAIAAELHFERGRAVGSWRSWSPNGELLTQFEFSGGYAEGPALRRFADGRLSASMRFDDGRLAGRRVVWRRSGRLAADDGFVDGEREGTCLRYFDSGTPMFAEHHSNGSLLLRLAWSRDPPRLGLVETQEAAIKFERAWPVIEPRGANAFEETRLYGPWQEPDGAELLRDLVALHAGDEVRQLTFPEVAVIAK